MSTPEFVEGVGNEVLALLAFTVIVTVLSIAWYSTYLTPSQLRLTTPRIEVDSVRVNTHHHDTVQASTGAELQQTVDHSEHNITGSTIHPQQNDDAGDPNPRESVSPAQTADQFPVTSTPPTNAVNDQDIATPDLVGESIPAPSPTTTDGNSSSGSSSLITIRLKYLTETERTVQCKPSDTVDVFRRNHFASELSRNKTVRFICNGQALQDGRTLQSYNIASNTVIHVLITDNATSSSAAVSTSPDAVFNAGTLMVPLFTIILTLCWYLRIEYGHLFNVTSTFSLVSITLGFALFFMVQRLPHPSHHTQPTNQLGISIRTNVHGNNSYSSHGNTASPSPAGGTLS